MGDFLFRGTLPLLERALDATALRHGILSNNIANVETPGFKRSDVDFAEILRGQSGHLAGVATNSRHIPLGRSGSSSSVHIQEENTTLRNDGNNVDVDREMALLAQNTLMFNALAQQVSGELNKLKSVIKEAR